MELGCFMTETKRKSKRLAFKLYYKAVSVCAGVVKIGLIIKKSIISILFQPVHPRIGSWIHVV